MSSTNSSVRIGSLRAVASDTDAGRAFLIGYCHGKELHVCGINTMDAQAVPLRGIFDTDDIPELSHDHNWYLSENDEDWIFSLLSGEGTEAIMDTLSVPREERDLCNEDVRKLLSAAAEHLSEHMDARAVSALSRADGKSLDQLSFYSGEGERATRRRQAAESYPLAAALMAKEVRLKIAIDRSQSLAPILKEVLENRSGATISKGVMKRLARAPELPAGCSLETVARFASLVPADWIPTEGDQWRAFCHSAECLLTELGASDEDIADLVKGRAGDWERFLFKAAKDGGREVEDLDGAISFTRSMMGEAYLMSVEFADMFLLPAAAIGVTQHDLTVTPEMRTAAIQSAYAMLFKGRSAIEIADLTRRWSLNREKINDAIFQAEDRHNQLLVGSIEEGSWPQLTEEVVAPSGIRIVPLTSPEQLRNEGSSGEDPAGNKGLSHCVGGYHSSAVKADCHIVSVRRYYEDGRFDRLATVEFSRLSPNDNKLTVKQSRARSNSQPCRAAKDALTWYVNSVAVGRVPLQRQRIDAFQEMRMNGQKTLDGLGRLCGYEWKEDSVIQIVAKAWGPYVTDSWKRRKMDDIMASDEVSFIAENIVPDVRMARF
ncbi:PcfJ domain-containing protein [Roseibium sp. RKSG952]|uniref:PcfJ domain-containing protein n=1 Tax=Roseibium sp. RKSG952 TaxID=2529384 RepID=UPI0012BBFED1|nr:PcfJ domain-containing protein [Roseibium sp. RKSG952]MTH95984.1 hypothetical protein [Roseibium sp. RKSG952]